MRNVESERYHWEEVLNKARSDLAASSRKAEEHLIENHNGIPATTCHDCLNNEHEVRELRYLILKLEKQLGSGSG
jgi:hypothetical protein